MEVNNKIVEYLIGKLYEDLERSTHELLEADKQTVEMDKAFEEAMREVAKIDLYKTQLEELNKKLETLEKEVVMRDIKIQELEAEMLKSTIESVGSEVRRGRPKKEV